MIETIERASVQREAREIAEGMRRAGSPGCEPWCESHYLDPADPDDPGVCYSDPLAIYADGPYLVNGHDGWGCRIWTPELERAQPYQAEAWARRILELVELARQGATT